MRCIRKRIFVRNKGLDNFSNSFTKKGFIVKLNIVYQKSLFLLWILSEKTQHKKWTENCFFAVNFYKIFNSVRRTRICLHKRLLKQRKNITSSITRVHTQYGRGNRRRGRNLDTSYDRVLKTRQALNWENIVHGGIGYNSSTLHRSSARQSRIKMASMK